MVTDTGTMIRDSLCIKFSNLPHLNNFELNDFGKALNIYRKIHFSIKQHSSIFVMYTIAVWLINIMVYLSK